MAFAEESFIGKEGDIYKFVDPSNGREFEFQFKFRDFPANSEEELYIRLRTLFPNNIYNLIESHVKVRLLSKLNNDITKVRSVATLIYFNASNYINADIIEQGKSIPEPEDIFRRREEIASLPDPPEEPMESEVLEWQRNQL